MRPMKPDPGIRVQAVRIPTENGGMSALLLSPLAAPKNAAGILWLHGGAQPAACALTADHELIAADAERRGVRFQVKERGIAVVDRGRVGGF